jgi:beta-xylosidase
MLTQRIFADKTKETKGTVRLDVSNLAEGDRAGICIFQDPYAAIAVEKKNGKLQLVWWKAKVKDAGAGFKAKMETKEVELPDGIIYLRAGMKYGEDNAKFYYSTDNKTWTAMGEATHQTFNLTVFVGARFGLFCYASKKAGGYADFDWFTTEASFTDPTGIFDTRYQPSKAVISVHNLSGQQVRLAANAAEALQGLPSGVYIVDGEKVVVK